MAISLTEIIEQFLKENGHECHVSSDGVVVAHDNRGAWSLCISTNKTQAIVNSGICGQKKFVDVHRPGSLSVILDNFRDCLPKRCGECEYKRDLGKEFATTMGGLIQVQFEQASKAMTMMAKHMKEMSLSTAQTVDGLQNMAKLIGCQQTMAKSMIGYADNISKRALEVDT